MSELNIHKKICPICSRQNSYYIDILNSMILEGQDNEEIKDKFIQGMIKLENEEIEEHKKFMLYTLSRKHQDIIIDNPSKYSDLIVNNMSDKAENYDHAAALGDIVKFITTRTLPTILSVCSTKNIDGDKLAKYSLSADRISNILLKFNEAIKGRTWSDYEGKNNNADNKGVNCQATRELQEIFGGALDNAIEPDKKDLE